MRQGMCLQVTTVQKETATTATSATTMRSVGSRPDRRRALAVVVTSTLVAPPPAAAASRSIRAGDKEELLIEKLEGMSEISMRKIKREESYAPRWQSGVAWSWLIGRLSAGRHCTPAKDPSDSVSSRVPSYSSANY
jgi:hypothetical protein